MLTPASVIVPSSPDAVKSLQTLGESAMVTVNAPVPIFEVALKNTLSAAVGTDEPAFAETQVCEVIVPLLLVVHVFTLPLIITPLLAPVASKSSTGTTIAGEPTVVKVLPARLAVKDSGTVEDQLSVLVLLQVPVPPTQYRSAMLYSEITGLPSASKTIFPSASNT